jgi:hypothetical protein
VPDLVNIKHWPVPTCCHPIEYRIRLLVIHIILVKGSVQPTGIDGKD